MGRLHVEDKGEYVSACVCVCLNVCLYISVRACVCVCVCWDKEGKGGASKQGDKEARRGEAEAIVTAVKKLHQSIAILKTPRENARTHTHR